MASGGVQTTRTIMINFAGSVGGLVNATKQAQSGIMNLGAGVVNIGKSFLSALGGNFKPLLQTVVGGVMAFAKTLFLIPAFLIAIVNPMNVVSIAMTGFSQAISASDPQSFVGATRNMAPAMREAVMSVRMLEPQLKNLYGIVEQGFWSGFSGDLTKLAQIYFPILNTTLGSLGVTLGKLRTEFMQFLETPAVVAAIQNWVSAFAGLGTPILALIESLLPTVISLFTTFSNILVSVLPLVTTLAASFARMVQWIAPIISGISGIVSGISGTLSGSGGGTGGGSSGGGSTGGGIGGFFSGLISGIGGFFTNLFGGGRAMGGPVLGGHSYQVGEQGPEMLTMGKGGGFITSRGSGSGDSHTHVTVKIGETELRGMISHEIAKSDRAVAMASRMGRGLTI